MSRDDVNLIFIRAIHQILHRVRSKVEGSDKESLENVLANLETNDPDFNSYSLVRLLRKRIDVAITLLVEAKLQSVVLEGDGHDVVPLIMEEVMASPVYTELVESALSDVKAAMDTMLLNQAAPTDDPSHQTPQGDSTLSSTVSSSGTHFLSLDNSLASGLSGDFNQTGLWFMSPQQFSDIVRGIAQSDDQQTRLESLHHLLQFPTGDTLNSEDWPVMRRALTAALAEPRVDISIVALKFVARMLSTATVQTAKEGFSILVEHMSAYYQSCDAFPVAMVTGIDLQDEECGAIMKRFRLINMFMVEVPNYWIRYSLRIVEQFVSQSLSLLSLPFPSSPSSLTPVVTPIHFISLLDPQAVWFRKWMHGQYSRKVVLKQLKNHPKMLEDCVRAVLGFEGFLASCPSQEPHRTNAQTTHYSEEEITCAFFAHALSIIERVLLFTDGRKLFPVSVDSAKAPVTPSQILGSLIHLIFTSHFAAQPHTREFCPASLVMTLFYEIALSSRCCEELVCVEQVVDALLQPLKAYLSRTMPAWKPSADTLQFVAEILAVIASQEHGRHFLLYGPKGKIADTNYSAPAHTIANFTVCALKCSLSSSIPPEVVEAFILVCRQCYNTCDGLLVLKEYTLHKHIAAAMTKSSGSHLSKDAVLDNMLNFAATPQGLLLLHQTDVLLQCVVYMLERYKMKSQVSKCQKFGYGCMVTQVASTASGMKALLDSGFVSMFVETLWDVLDGDDDERLVSATTGPLDPTDRVAHKALVNLLNVLSAFPAVYEALNCAPQHNSTSTVLELLNKTALWEGEERGRGLVNPEDAHLCGLRILGVLVTSLDTFLLLESEYHITSILLSLQAASQLPNGNYIIDAPSVERNWILVATHCPGGPNERVLPPHTLTDPFDWPLFSKYPVPREYCKGRQQQPMKSATNDKSLQSFLSLPLPSTVAEATKWMDKCRGLLVQVFAAGTRVPSKVLFGLMQSCATVALVIPANKSLPQISPTRDSRMLTLPKDGPLQLGSALAVRYGERVGALKMEAREAEERALEELQWKIGRMLVAQQHQRAQWELGYLGRDYPGYDWFVASLFLLAQGRAHAGEVTKFAVTFSQLLLSCFIWPQRIHKSAHLPLSVAISGMSPLLYVSAHCIEMLLQVEVPHVHSAFKLSGYTPAQICQHWLTQCFWNYLDWDQVVLYLTLCIVMGVDYQMMEPALLLTFLLVADFESVVYFCVAVFRYLEKNILKHVQEHNLLVFLKEEPFYGFSVQDHLHFMQQLEKKHRHVVLKDMKNFASL